MKKIEKTTKGIPIRKFNFFLTALIFVISVFLLISAYKTSLGYRTLLTSTNDYIEWEKRANQMMIGSDYLTEQVRCFAETGKREFLDNYFYEANEALRRDKALDFIKDRFSDSEAYTTLLEAMNQSVLLMDREYYSMRLKIDSMGLPVSDFPEEIRNVEISEADADLSDEEKSHLACSLVFDDYYHTIKENISSNTALCLEDLAMIIGEKQQAASTDLRNLLINEQVLIVALIAIVILIVTLTTLQVISPLVLAVPRIKEEKPIPVKGASEFRFLANTYNQMYESNKKSTEKLQYKASHDQLTGLYNRSGFDKLLKGLDFTSTTLILADVDKFKSVNDNYGHEAGDEALRRVAASLNKFFRCDDYICRIGGDEFAIFLINSDKDKKDMIRSKAAAINNDLMEKAGSSPAISMSFGVAFGGKQRAGDSFKNADVALYRAKANGRSRCEFYEQ